MNAVWPRTRAWPVPMTEARWLFIRQAVLVPIRPPRVFLSITRSSMGAGQIGVKLFRRYSTSALRSDYLRRFPGPCHHPDLQTLASAKRLDSNVRNVFKLWIASNAGSHLDRSPGTSQELRSIRCLNNTSQVASDPERTGTGRSRDAVTSRRSRGFVDRISRPYNG